MRPKYVSDAEVVEELQKKLKTEGKTVKALADELGVSYPFLASYVRRTWPHAQPKLLESFGFEPKRYYRRKA